jgi:hypothetical protein
VKRLVTGALVLLVAAAVGAGLGYAAYSVLVYAIGYYVAVTSSDPPSTMFMRGIMETLVGVAAVGGIFLGVWLLRRLFGVRTRQKRSTPP